MALHCPHSIAALAVFFSELNISKLDVLGDIYSPGVEFCDPINEARGIGQLRGVYADLLKRKHDLNIAIEDAHGDERTGFLLWKMTYSARGGEREISGISHVAFASDGRISRQRDHWDASWSIYGEFPLTGWLMKRLRRIVATHRQ